MLFRRKVTRSQARRIARDASPLPLEKFHVYDSPQPGWKLYNNWGDEPCWYVTMPSENFALQSTRVAILSRMSGKVLAICSANDEG
jgi:hypothetical protein